MDQGKAIVCFVIVFVNLCQPGGQGKVQQGGFENLIACPPTQGASEIKVFELVMFKERICI